MRILFFMSHAGYVRNFEWALRELAGRGHQVTIVFDSRKAGQSELAAYDQLGRISLECSPIAFAELVPPETPSLAVVATRRLRLIQDYLRYLDPVFSNATKLRQRSSSYLDGASRSLLQLMSLNRTVLQYLSRFFHGLDELIPYPRFIDHTLRKLRPDLVMVTPLFGHGSIQADYFKAAKEFGLRSCLAVASWDNLTTKGVAHAKPDRVLVWNESQKQEAVCLHQLPPESVAVTGAHSYDHWFKWRPSTSREAFLAKLGLAVDEPYILYLGSSSFIAPDEAPIVLKWGKALRSSRHPALRNVGILVRPHPQNAERWSQTDISCLGNAVVYPAGGSNPVNQSARNDYFDSMYFCRVVVGANTSGLIEAGILGKPVHTVLFDELVETQKGTPHFHHIAAEDGGLLNVSNDLAEHVEKLAAALVSVPEGDNRRRAFVQRFVRPANLSKRPSEVFSDFVEAQGKEPAPQPVPVSAVTWFLRIVAAPLLLLLLPEYVYVLVRDGIRLLRRGRPKLPATIKLQQLPR
jgi:hypothetical protein